MHTWRKTARRPERAEIDRFREFLPPGGLTDTGFDKLVDIARVSVVPAGHHLFRAGENDPLSIFLLQGRVELEYDGNRTVVAPGADAARYALANLKPRRFNGRALTDACVMHLDNRLLEKLVAWDQTSRGAVQGMHVEELDGGEDPEWFLHMLGSPIFMRVPTANVEALVGRFEPVPVEAGETVIEQGAAGRDYFIIRRGACEVLRQSGPGARPARIAERRAGEGIGEEALLSDKPRDATVRMLTDGLLMKLDKSDFDALLKPPLLDWIDEDGVLARMKEGAALIDVRLEDEFGRGSLEGAINIPLYLLRMKLDQLERGRHYIAFCDTGERSATAAFLLGTRGLTSSAIDGGLNTCTRLRTT